MIRSEVEDFLYHEAALLDEWRLDDQTKEIGRKGLADARAALQEAMRRAAA